MDSPLEYFAELRDLLMERTPEHLLEEILQMTVAVVSKVRSHSTYGN